MTASTPSPLASLKIDRLAQGGRRRRRWPWVLGAVGLGVVALLGLAPRKVPVQVASVQMAWPSAQHTQLSASGYVVAQRRAAVSSKATGRLVELTVREGSVVKQGELIARLDASDLQANLGVGQAAVGQAEAGLKQAEAALNQARVQQANADDDLKRTQGLAAQNFVSPQALDTAQTRARAAQTATLTAQAAVNTARAAVAQAQAQLQVARVSRDSAEIRAPFDGVVLSKNANVGDLITPFSNAAGTSGAVVTLADMGTLEVEADVSESSVAKVKVDMPVEITLDAIPEQRFRGSVARIVPTVDRAKATVMTKVRFDKLDSRILPEMSAKVSFLSQRVADADQTPVLAVAAKAVVDGASGPQVWRLGAGDALELVPVQRGRMLGDQVELLGKVALKAGDKVVLQPDPALKAGAVAEVKAAGAAK